MEMNGEYEFEKYEFEKIKIVMTDDEKFALHLLAENSQPIKQFYEALENAVQLAEKAMLDLAEKCVEVSRYFDWERFGEGCKTSADVLRITVNNFHENNPVCPEINTAKLNTAAFALRKCGATLVLSANNMFMTRGNK